MSISLPPRLLPERVAIVEVTLNDGTKLVEPAGRAEHGVQLYVRYGRRGEPNQLSDVVRGSKNASPPGDDEVGSLDFSPEIQLKISNLGWQNTCD